MGKKIQPNQDIPNKMHNTAQEDELFPQYIPSPNPSNILDEEIKQSVELKGIEELHTATGPITPVTQPTSKIVEKNTPPSGSRNSYGLLDNLDYDFDESGFVNYKKLIPQEYLVPNKQYFERFKKPLPTTTEGLSDKEVLVLLVGWKQLLNFREFKSVNHDVISVSRESVTVKTTIIWKGNYETGFEDVSFSALATASIDNTFNFARNYLAEIAENRGLCRAIRGFLRIPIVGFDEVGPQSESEANTSEGDMPIINKSKYHAVLQQKMIEYNISWDTLKTNLVAKKYKDAENWNTLLDIPSTEIWAIVGRMDIRHKEKLEEAKNKASKEVKE